VHRRMVNKGCHVNAVHVKRLLYLSCRERWCLIVPLGRGRSKVPRALCTRPYLVSGHTHSVKWSHPLCQVVTPTLSSGHTHSVKWSHPLPLKFLCELIAYVGCRHTHYPTHQLADTHRLRTHPPISMSPLLRWIPQSVAHSDHHWI